METKDEKETIQEVDKQDSKSQKTHISDRYSLF